jgi:FlgN protein
MTVTEVTEIERHTDPVLTIDVLGHLEAQLESAHRMLAVVLEQGAAIRERVVPEVVRLATALQAEMHRREVIELERLDLLERASLKLGASPADISIRMLTVLMDEDSATLARDRTAQLRELLRKVQREHTTNRALMQQELSFLDHLLRLAGSAGGYANTGHQSTGRRGAPLHRPVFDLEA